MTSSCEARDRRWASHRRRNSSSDVICCSALDDVISDREATEVDNEENSSPTDSSLPSDRSAAAPDVPDARDFRLVSWNILTDNCIGCGQYLYCPSDKRFMTSRHQRIVDELKVIDPDVVCLQEADADNFRLRLQPEMERLGYDGVSHPTSNGQGLATFWRGSKFEVIKVTSKVISDVISERLAKNSDVDESTIRLLEEWSNRPELTSFVLLRHLETGNEVAVCNNHVGWMRLRQPTLQATQIAMAFHELFKFVDDSSSCCLIFCGDFNTPPTFPAYQLLSSGSLGKTTYEKFAEHYDDVIDEVDWKNFEVISKAIPEIFQLPVMIQSAYFTLMGHEPSVTNCDGAHDDGVVRSFCLDYIWYRKLTPVRVLETPAISGLTESDALPNETFPSDHVPIATDFNFR